MHVKVLSELEECLELRRLEMDPQRCDEAHAARSRLAAKWTARLRGCRLEVIILTLLDSPRRNSEI